MRGNCPACNVVDGCGGIAHAEIEGHCCRCIPQRVCASLFLDENVCNSAFWTYPDAAISTVEAAWLSDEVGCARQYAGTFLCGETSIDFRIRFRKDEYTGVCFMCLESESLGYTYAEGGTPEQDLRVCVQMGGDYADSSIKRAECRAMEFEFPIDYYGSAGVIAISPAPYVEEIKRRPGLHCMFERACITVFDGYEETVHHVCTNQEYASGWTFLKDDNPGQRVTITVIDHDSTGNGSTTLSLDSWLNPYEDVEIVAEAECPDMRAAWELPDGAWIAIKGDKLNKCTDCKCYCECLCVTIVEDETTFDRGMACRQLTYDGCGAFWEIELNDKVFTFYLECLNCETPRTFLTLELPYGMSLAGSESQSVVCPDQLEAEWALGGTGGSIYVQCAPCGSECSLDELSVVVPCCPDSRVPVSLYATVLSSTGCSQFPDGTVIPLLKQGAIIGAPTNCWYGKVTVQLGVNTCIQEFALACYEEIDGITSNWRMIASDCESIDSSLSSPICSIISCDPLILEVTLTPVGCCDDGVGASITLRITA